MPFQLRFTPEASDQLTALEVDRRRLKKVRHCLARLQENPRHPGLRSHKYQSLGTPDGRDVWESYVENRTPGAWRVFWTYGPGPDQITVLSITPHP